LLFFQEKAYDGFYFLFFMISKYDGFLFFIFYDFPMGYMSIDDFPILPSGVWVYYIVAE
jgi:hypothetical protein